MPNKATRIGIAGYSAVLRSLADVFETSEQVALRHGLHVGTARKMLRRLHDMRVIRVADWVSSKPRALACPVYAFGDGPDVPRPPCRCTGEPSRHHGATTIKAKPQPELVAFASLIKALCHASTANELAERTGIHFNTIRKAVKHMQAIGLIHIAEWEVHDTGGKKAPMYRLGVGKANKAKPRARTSQEIQKKYRDGLAQRKRLLRITHALASNASVFNQAQAA